MKKLICMILAILMLAGAVVAVSAADGSSFKDVKTTRWSYGAINYAVEKGYMNGIGDNKFDPAGSMTRGMVVTVLYRREGSPAVTFRNDFSDVKAGKYYSDAVIWAKDEGVVNGITETTFEPNGKITREQLATMLNRYAKLEGKEFRPKGNLSAFPDASKTHSYAKDAMIWATDNGLITGVKSGGAVLLDPRGAATREQFAAILMRFDTTDLTLPLEFNEPVFLSSYTEPDYPLVEDADFYVSPDGNDGASGSLSDPFATFDRAVTRLSARRMGIRTESSGRFERGVSANDIPVALDRACQLVNMLDAGDVVGGRYDLYEKLEAPKPIVCSVKRLAARTGVDITADEMVKALEKLNFSVALDGDTLTATAPEYRQDVERDADICEEVLRMVGYDRIPSTRLRGETTPGGLNPWMQRKAVLRKLLSGLGYDEMMTFSFVSLKSIAALGLEKGCFVGLTAGKKAVAQKTAGVLRTKLGALCPGHMDKEQYQFCWIVDFPMYEIGEESGELEFCHNPFSMPDGGLETLEKAARGEIDPLTITACQYDLVINGYESASGAVRNHDPEIMVKAFELVRLGEEDVKKKFPAMYNAFTYGAPPHAGAAPGVDRLIMLLTGEESIREVITFPMNKNAQDVMMDAPSAVTEKQLEELGIAVVDEEA